MEKNCLITTYKATVDNPELKVLGELVLKFKNVEANIVLITLRDNPVFEYVKIDKNVQSQGGVMLPAGILRPGTYEEGIKSIEAGDYTLRIKSKYKVNNLFLPIPVEMDLNDLQFIETMSFFSGRKVIHTGSPDIKLPNIRDIGIFSDTKISITELIKSNTTACRTNCAKGNIEDVKEFLPNITQLNLFESWELYGDFKCLGMTQVNTFEFCILRTLITGNVEDFVAVRRESGRTSGEVTFKFLGDGGRIKFNGITITNVENNTISWDETTITFNGETITA